MIWFILYILIAALITFAFCVAAIKLDVRNSWGEFPTATIVACGALWPIAAPFYAALIVAKWFSGQYGT